MSLERHRRPPASADATASTITPDQLADDLSNVLDALRPRPLVWLEAIDGWFVVGHAAATTVLRDAATFTVDDPRFSTARVLGPSMLSLDGSEHRRHRRPFQSLFDRRSVTERTGARLAATAEALVRELAPTGRADLRHELAAPLAVRAVADALGLAVEPSVLLGWYRNLVSGVEAVSAGRALPETTRTAAGDLRRAVAAARADPAGVLHLATVHADLDDAEVFSNTAVAMFGAIETGEAMTANALWHLLCNPAWLANLAGDASLMAAVIDESLRLEPAASVLDRYATRTTELAGARIEAGDLVRVSVTGANRDPTVFDDANRFHPGRPGRDRHLAFAVGPHACIATHMARTETATAVNAAVTLLPGLELDAAASSEPSGAIFRKPQQLMATWQRRDEVATPPQRAGG